MFKKLKGLDYKYFVCVFITIALLLLSFFFIISYIRLYESIKDLGLSIAYYFCELLQIPYTFKPSINNISSTSQLLIDNFNMIDFSNFKLYFGIGFNASLNKDTFLRYINNVLRFLSRFSKVLIFIVPIIFLIVLMYRKYFNENDNEPNSDSKALKMFKWLEFNIYIPIREWFKSFVFFVQERKYFIYIWLIILCLHFNLFTIIIEFLSFYFYFAVSFDFLSIFKQLYKLLIDLIPILQSVPLPIWLLLALYIFNNIRKNIAYQILNHNEMKNRGFINSIGQVCMVCSPPGVGKTTVLTDWGLSLGVMFRDKALEKILENDLKFPFFPFINFENEIKRAINFHQILWFVL